MLKSIMSRKHLNKEVLAVEREKLLKEINVAQEELLKINVENDSLQASKVSMQTLIEELQLSKDALIAKTEKDQEERDHLADQIKKLITENFILAKDKDDIIQKLQSSYEELVKDQKALVQDIEDLTAEKKSAFRETVQSR